MNYIFWILFSALWIYFVFAHLEKTGLAGILGALVVAPIFMVIIAALDTFAALVGAFFGVWQSRKK